MAILFHHLQDLTQFNVRKFLSIKFTRRVPVLIVASDHDSSSYFVRTHTSAMQTQN